MKKLLFALSLSCTALFAEVQESILGHLYTEIEPHKYSTSQYDEIQKHLANKENAIRVATFNTLFDFYDHKLPEVYRWPQRKGRVLEIIHHLQPDILGVQEVYPHLLQDLVEGLKDYTFVGEPDQSGEINGIFYKTERFENPRFRFTDPLNSVTLQDKRSGKELAFCNMHLAYRKIDLREAEARDVHRIISEFSLPIVLVGDMNTFPNLPQLKKLPFLDGDRINAILKGSLLCDARECALLGHHGPLSTFTNTEDDIAPFRGKGTPGVFLDHIYVTRNVTVLIHAVETGFVDGLYPSDHFPLIADIILQ